MPTSDEPSPAPPPASPRAGHADPPRPRVVGVDLARGLAVLGMFAAHILATPELSWDPTTWSALVHGRSSILFAVLAGVSIALISGGTRPAGDETLAQTRVRVIVRAVLLFALGGLLQTFGYVAVILEVYAVLTVVTLPFWRWRARGLFMLAGALALVMPPLTLALAGLGWSHTPGIVTLLVTGHYPALIWTAFGVLGLGLGRLDLGSARVAARLVRAGGALAVVGYAAGWLTTALVVGGQSADTALTGAGRVISGLTGAEPHSGTPAEVVGSSGVAMLVLGLCLLAPAWLERLLRPVSAAGTMALTLYAAHIPALSLFAGPREQHPVTTYAAFATMALAFAWGWQRWVGGKGPLERFFAWVVRRATGPSPARAGG